MWRSFTHLKNGDCFRDCHYGVCMRSVLTILIDKDRDKARLHAYNAFQLITKKPVTIPQNSLVDELTLSQAGLSLWTSLTTIDEGIHVRDEVAVMAYDRELNHEYLPVKEGIHFLNHETVVAFFRNGVFITRENFDQERQVLRAKNAAHLQIVY
jgi:hypothetical protein